MFSNHDDDDLFNPTSTNSHLASLFGTAMTVQRDSDASLVYTAPKQPKPNGQETSKIAPKPSTSQSSVVCSEFVEAFKLLDSNYVATGKCGIAIIGSESLKTYEVILYRTKQDILSRSKLRADISFNIQANDFVSFCDDQKTQWTVHFNDAKVLEEFTEKIRTCNGTVIPHMKPADICDKKSSPNKIQSEPIKGPGSPSLSKRDSDSSDNSSSQTRASILSRMAKMGQPILPMNLSKSSEQTDSETDEQTVSKKPIKKKQKPVLVNGEYISSDKVKNINSNYNQTLSMQTPSEFLMINGQIVPVSALTPNLSTQLQPSLPNPYITSLPNPVMLNPQVSPLSESMHVFIAENRTHNCEMRMNVTQLSSKLDNILLKLNQGSHSVSEDMPNKNELELRILEKTKELETNEEVIKNLQEQAKKLQEDVTNKDHIINNSRKDFDNQKKVIVELEQRICELEKSRNNLEEQITQNRIDEEKMLDTQQIVIELQQIIEDQKIKIQNLEKSCEGNKQNQGIESTVDNLNKEISNLKAQLDDKNSKSDLFSKKLKQSMNILYQQIMENFDQENISFQSVEIKQILSQKLKNATLQIIQEFQSDFMKSDL